MPFIPQGSSGVTPSAVNATDAGKPAIMTQVDGAAAIHRSGSTSKASLPIIQAQPPIPVAQTAAKAPSMASSANNLVSTIQQSTGRSTSGSSKLKYPTTLGSIRASGVKLFSGTRSSFNKVTKMANFMNPQAYVAPKGPAAPTPIATQAAMATRPSMPSAGVTTRPPVGGRPGLGIS